MSNRAVAIFLATTVLALGLAAYLGRTSSEAASHREAPLIALDPTADITDFFMFRSYETGKDNKIILIMDVIPGEEPSSGPNYERAVEFFQKMIDLKPQLSSYSRVSYMRELHGDISGAIDAMKMAVSAGGLQRENTAWARVHLGNLYINSGDYRSAEREFEAALIDVPDYVHAYAGLANLRIAQGRPRDAVELYQRVVEKMRLPSYRILLADLYDTTG